MALACVWLQLLKLRKTATSQGCKYDVRRGGMKHSTTCGKSGLHGGQGGLAGVDAGHVPEKDPRLSFFAWVHHVVQCGRELQDVVVVAQSFSDVTWRVCSGQGCSGKTASVLPACTICTRATVHAEGDRERGTLCFALQLSLFDAAAAPPDLMHREEATGGLVDVHEAVCADCVLVHQPAQLDEQPVRVGLLQSRAVELLQALGGLLEAQTHAMH